MVGDELEFALPVLRMLDLRLGTEWRKAGGIERILDSEQQPFRAGSEGCSSDRPEEQAFRLGPPPVDPSGASLVMRLPKIMFYEYYSQQLLSNVRGISGVPQKNVMRSRHGRRLLPKLLGNRDRGTGIRKVG